jgi:hypothetical protein
MSNGLKDLFFVICTKYDKIDFQTKSTTFDFIWDNNLVEMADYIVFYENKEGLPTCYNKYIIPELKSRIMVFMHDDLIIPYHHKTLRRELNRAHEKFNIVGLAGSPNIELKYPTLWHHMAKTIDGKKSMSGSVGHKHNDQNFMTCFGVCPSQCVVLDGLFLSIDVDKILTSGLKFDEKFKFHHYDISFCLDANKLKLSMGTWPIWLTHLSPGLKSLEDTEWKKSNAYFCKKYSISY